MSNYNGWTSLPQSLAASFSGVSQPSRAARRRRFMDSCCRICAAANASMARLVSVRGSIRKPGEFVLLTFGSRTKEPRQCWRRGGNKDERVAHISTPSRMAELQGRCGSAVLCRCILMTKGRRRGRKQEREDAGHHEKQIVEFHSFHCFFVRVALTSLSTDQTTVFILCMRDGKVSESLTSNFEPLAVRMMSGSLDKSATQ